MTLLAVCLFLCTGVIALGECWDLPFFQSIMYVTALDAARRPTVVGIVICGSGPTLALDDFVGGDIFLPHRRVAVVAQHGAIVEEQGLLVSATQLTLDLGPLDATPGAVWRGTSVIAVTGRTGDPDTAWTQAPWMIARLDDACLRFRPQIALKGPRLWTTSLETECARRQQPGYFHLIPVIQQAVDKEQWPAEKGKQLFIATPRRGIETELTELLLLESLVEEAESGDEHSRLLLNHIEEECAAPLAEVIQAQRSKLEIMLEDQRAQLLIHAEAVKRTEKRGRLMAAEGEPAALTGNASSGSVTFESKSNATPSATLSSASSSAIKLTSAPSASAVSAASSTSSSSTLASASSSVASSSDALHPPPAYSWTQRPEFKDLQSLRSPGRKKYGTIMKAALRFLHSLKPKSVNRSGGSHVVFHFQSGSPVTLVRPHSGSGSKDGTRSGGYCTRLYEVMHEAALQQFQATGELPEATSQRVLTAASKKVTSC